MNSNVPPSQIGGSLQPTFKVLFCDTAALRAFFVHDAEQVGYGERSSPVDVSGSLDCDLDGAQQVSIPSPAQYLSKALYLLS